MRFGSPLFFWLLLAIPLLVGFFIYAFQKRQEALRRFASAELIARLSPSTLHNRRIVRSTLVLCALFFLIIALCRPRFGVTMSMVERKGIDIIVALDVSRSMLAEDILPNRLDRAKHETARFIDLLKGDRIGIVIFAGESFVECPLTLDYGAAKLFLQGIAADWIGLQGTALADAISKSDEAFNSKTKKHKVLIMISDGEDHEGDAVEAARKAAENGVRIYTIGVGSEKGVPIPIAGAGQSVVYKKDNAGNLVLTRLDPMMLEKIALESHGKYFHAGTSLDLQRIYQEIATMEKKSYGMNQLNLYEEQYQVFLLIGLILLLASYIIPERSERSESSKRQLANSSPGRSE